ncbi:MAG: hypothetical protein HOE19_00825 [Candidatus Komeilibacteria bacterium]|jgi:hypothetical protein|nr:hypothetical protein [Candidatus Komeilibacteria bacterium]MBT4447608.1 hypothetical protein [Candidatus Komeilibacteria bacterium]
MSIGNFIVGLLIAGIGYLLVWKSNWLLNNFGRIGWAEAHLGTEGGSRLMYKLIGSIIIIAGFLHATNLGGIFIRWIASSIFGADIA